MCGRYSLGLAADALEVFYGARWVSALQKSSWNPRYNMAPEQRLPVVLNVQGARVISHMRWGLVPSWAKDELQGTRSINARAETIEEKPMFRDAFLRRRCLVIADGFYEWNDAKTPYRACLPGAEPHAYAGLWERWQSPSGEMVESFCIITRDAVGDLRTVHHRMPVLLSPEDYDFWLNESNQDTVALKRLLYKKPYQLPRPYEVSKAVNSAKIDNADCVLAEAEISEKQMKYEMAESKRQVPARDQLSFGWTL